jgi:uncharacterized peroxidase-related enzyme
MTSVPPLVNMVMDDEAKGKVKELYEQLKESSGQVPKWMRVMANNEDVLVGFFSMFKAIMDDAPVDKMLKWKIAYVVSEMNKCEFCVSVSKKMLTGMGMSEEEMGKLEEDLNEKEQVAMDYAKAATEHAYNIDEAIFDKMKQHYSDEEIVEITSVVGLFAFINRFNDSLGVLPDIK